MASSVGEREARLERQLPAGVVLLPTVPALTTILLTACGGGDPVSRMCEIKRGEADFVGESR